MEMLKNKTPKGLLIAFTVLLSGFIIMGEAAVIRGLYIGKALPTAVHILSLIVFQILYTISLLKILRGLFSKKIAVISAILINVALAVIWITLLGFRLYVLCLCLSIALLSFTPVFVFGIKKQKIGFLTTALTIVICGIMSFLFYFSTEIKLADRSQNAPLHEYKLEDAALLPHAVKANKIHTLSVKTEGFSSDNLEAIAESDQKYILLKTLQGILSLSSDEQILFYDEIYGETGKSSFDDRINIIQKYYPDVEIEESESIDALLDKVGNKIENYILYDVKKSESVSSALNLCNQMNAVMLTKEQKYIAEKYGWKEVFDARNTDEEWLINSEYFDNLDKSICIMLNKLSFIDPNCIFDYAIVSNAVCRWHVLEQSDFESFLSELDRNFILLGGLGSLTENGIVNSCARFSGTFVFLTSTNNMSTLSSFRIENATPIVDGCINENNELQKIEKEYEKPENKHTVCIMLSDADNLRFFSEQCLTDEKFYGSDLRGENLSANFGLSGAAIEIVPITLISYYDKMYSSEDFVLQISSLGYTFPTQWEDNAAWKEATDGAVHAMKVADSHVVEIMDDKSFFGLFDVNGFFDSMKPTFDTYTSYEQIDGCLFIGFMDLYAGYEGEICWSNDKPVVSARYSVWNSEASVFASEKNDIKYIADEINSSSTDITSEDAYSFIIVHAWSGCETDENGNLKLVPDGNTMAVFNELQKLFDEDVEVVGAEEFIKRIRENVKR